MNRSEDKIIVIGASTGGLKTLIEVLSPLPHDFALPIVIVQHFADNTGNYFKQHLKKNINLHINTVNKPFTLASGNIYLAASNQHIRVIKTGLIEPYPGPKYNYVRPSVDVLFKSVAQFYGSNALALILTGSNRDGAEGCALIDASGGQIFIQDPLSAEAKQMPESSLKKVPTATVIECDKAAGILWDLAYRPKRPTSSVEQR